MRIRSLLAVLALLTSACGGGDGGALPLGTTDVAEAETAAVTLVERWGDEPAFYAVMASLDRGYSAAQVIEHADDLAADGSLALVSPDGPDLGLLSPLPSVEGASGRGIAAAPRRLVAGDDGLSPQNQYVDFLDTNLGEAYESAQRKLVEIREREAFVAILSELRDRSVGDWAVYLLLMLSASGYAADQVIEAIVLGDVDVRLGVSDKGCLVIPGDDGRPVQPQLHTMNLWCAGVFEETTTTTTSTTTTTTAGSGLVPGTGALDGVYEGTADLLFDDIPGVFEMVNSSVRAVVSGDDIEIDLVYELHYHPRYTNETPSCTAVVRDTWHGLGFVVGGLLELDLAPVSREILSLTGPACDVIESDGTARDAITAEFASEVAQAVFGSVSDAGVLSGEFGEFLSFTATK